MVQGRKARGAGGSGHRVCRVQGSIPGVFLLLSSIEFMMGESKLAQELNMCQALGSTSTPVHPDPHQNQRLSSAFILLVSAGQGFFFTTLFSSFPKTHIWITRPSIQKVGGRITRVQGYHQKTKWDTLSGSLFYLFSQKRSQHLRARIVKIHCPSS